jgi:nucleoside 2-deoxyribosyltransferase
MKYIAGLLVLDSDDVTWHVIERRESQEDGVIISFTLPLAKSNREVLTYLAENLKRRGIAWLQPVKSVIEKWVLNADTLKREFDVLQGMEWLQGPVAVIPECNIIDQKKQTHVQFVVIPEEIRDAMLVIHFPQLAPFIDRFQVDYPEPSKCAFLMMKYQNTKLHRAIIECIKNTCAQHGIAVLRADDDKRYADELLPNVRTYMHGCGFVIALFERIKENDLNPNVSFEVGYMLAMGKPVCLLKDSTLPSLQTDLLGSLYDPFDTQNPETDIPPVLTKWLREKSLIE